MKNKTLVSNSKMSLVDMLNLPENKDYKLVAVFKEGIEHVAYLELAGLLTVKKEVAQPKGKINAKRATPTKRLVSVKQNA